MFLRQVYKHNRWLFVLMVLFIIGQAFINIKQGAVVSPFYHYGMYSEVMPLRETYPVFEVKVNGKILQGKSFSPWQWDKIIQPLAYYSNLEQSNLLYINEVERLFGRFRLRHSSSPFVQKLDRATFLQWYKTYLTGIVQSPVETVELGVRYYIFNGNLLQPTDTIQPL